MEAFKQLRDNLGLTQTDLAMLLGVSRQMITLVESGRRSLPSLSCMKLSELEKSMSRIGLVNYVMPGETIDRLKTECNAWEVECRKRIHKLKAKLKCLAKAYAQHRRLMAVIKDIESAPEINYAYTETIRRRVLQQMEVCCPAAREKVRHEIQRYMSECTQIDSFRKAFLSGQLYY